MDDQDEFKCDQCRRDDMDTLYEGWFYTDQHLSPWAQGTASAGLMQIRVVCKECLNKLKELGLKV